MTEGRRLAHGTDGDDTEGGTAAGGARRHGAGRACTWGASPCSSSSSSARPSTCRRCAPSSRSRTATSTSRGLAGGARRQGPHGPQIELLTTKSYVAQVARADSMLVPPDTQVFVVKGLPGRTRGRLASPAPQVTRAPSRCSTASRTSGAPCCADPVSRRPSRPRLVTAPTSRSSPPSSAGRRTPMSRVVRRCPFGFAGRRRDAALRRRRPAVPDALLLHLPDPRRGRRPAGGRRRRAAFGALAAGDPRLAASLAAAVALHAPPPPRAGAALPARRCSTAAPRCAPASAASPTRGAVKCLHAHVAHALARPGYELGERVLAEAGDPWGHDGLCAARLVAAGAAPPAPRRAPEAASPATTRDRPARGAAS